MATKRANILTESDISKVLARIAKSPTAVEDTLKFELSAYAGLRVGEVAKLTTDAFLDANGNVRQNLTIFSHVAKRGRERIIPIHPKLRLAMEAFRVKYPNLNYVAVGREQQQQNVSALTVWFIKVYKKVGLEGCSSHSGRRTFITNLARRANHFHNSLLDVQLLAGHSDLKTTQAYIQPSKSTAEMVASLGSDDFEEDPNKTKKKSPKQAFSARGSYAAELLRKMEEAN